MKRRSARNLSTGLLLAVLFGSACSTPLDIEVSTDDTSIAEDKQIETTEVSETTETTEVDAFTITVEGDLAEPEDIVFKVTVLDNPPSPRDLAVSFPVVALHGDGRLVFHDDRDQVGMVSISELWLNPEGVEELVELANRVADDPGSPDWELSDPSDIALTSGSQRAPLYNGNYQELLTFARTVPDELLARGPQPVDHDRVLLITWDNRTPSSDATPVLPLDATGRSFHQARGGAVGCLEITGDQFDSLVPALEELDSSISSTWSIDGWTHRVLFRPLLATDPGCALLETL